MRGPRAKVREPSCTFPADSSHQQGTSNGKRGIDVFFQSMTSGSVSQRRLPLAVAAHLVTVLLIAGTGFWAGAYAASAETSWARFASEGSGADRRCAAHMARVYTPPAEPAGYGYVRYRSNSECSSAATANAGHLGVYLYVSRGDGTICGSTGWTYNITFTSTHTAGAVANCNWTKIRAGAQGRVWQQSTASYVTAQTWAITPYLN